MMSYFRRDATSGIWAYGVKLNSLNCPHMENLSAKRGNKSQNWRAKYLNNSI